MVVQATTFGGSTGIADALVASLNSLDRLKMTDLMSDYNSTIAVKRIFKKYKTVISDNGDEFQFNAITSTNGSARHVPLGYINQIDIPNVLTNGKMPWRHTTWNWATERRLIQMNAGKAKIVDLAQTQRLASLGDAILLFERTLWSVPSVTDFALNPVGIPYFVVKSATAATLANNNGFNGTVPSGYSTVANIDPTTGPGLRYCNYSDAYTNVTKPDLIAKMRRAMHYIDWMPLVDGIAQHDLGTDFGIYAQYDTVQALENILEAQNENLGNDIASKDDRALFRNNKITAVRALDTDTTGVVYILNWGTLGAGVLQNEWMREQHFPAELNQPTISATVTDCSWNMWCTNRRKQAVLSTGTTMTAPV